MNGMNMDAQAPVPSVVDMARQVLAMVGENEMLKGRIRELEGMLEDERAANFAFERKLHELGERG